MLKKPILLLAVLALAWPAVAADICVVATPNICHTTSAEENTASIYYRDLYDDNLCATKELPAACTKAEYIAAGGIETFYDRTGDGAKQYFMDRVIKAALTSLVSSYTADLDSRAKDIWSKELDATIKATTCVSWGKTSDCR